MLTYLKMATVFAIAAGTVHTNEAIAEDAFAPAGKEFFDTSAGRAPFSSAVRVGNVLYLSGMLGIKDRQLVTGGTGPETAQTLANIQSRLAEHGLTFADVVKCTVFLADMADFGAMNKHYTESFQPPRPARSAVGVNGLALAANVEIECIAAF